MSSLQSTSKKSFRAKVKSKTGSDEGKLYEKISLLLLAEKGYKLSKTHKPKFCDFAIGREVEIGKDRKFDDVVFSYIDQDNTKNFIFVQIKHKQDDYQIDSQVLSTEDTRAKNIGGTDGGMCRDFNLQKYFISYLSVRDELKITKSKELINGKIKYVAIFTNIGIDSDELNDKGFTLKTAPDDIVALFNLKKSSSKTQALNYCYQLSKVCEILRKILFKSSDLHRLAKEFSQYILWKDYSENKIMGIDKTPIKHYHVALENEVIQKSDEISYQSPKNKMKNVQYCEAQFKEDFLDSDKTAAKQFRGALFEAIRDLDETKNDASDEELKRVLKDAKWKTVPNFGKSKQNSKRNLPTEWETVTDADINDFLNCLVFIVNQPRVTELESIFKSSIQDTVVENTLLKQFLDKIYNTGEEFKNCIEKGFGINIKQNFKESWFSGDTIKNFIEEKKNLVSITFVISAMTLMYKTEVMQYGKFNYCGKIIESVELFLAGEFKILCINTPATLLSSIKILQHLDSKDYNAEIEKICVSADFLKSIENRDFLLKAFEIDRNCLLIIEWKHAVKEKYVEEFFFNLFNIAKRKSKFCKKIIALMQEEFCTIFVKNIKFDSRDENLHVLENDSIDLKSFKPEENPFEKHVIVFQGQQGKVSLAELTGINSWNSYVDYLSLDGLENNEELINASTLIKILNNAEIEVGTKPLDSSNLDGAYATLFEEIDVKVLVNKLISHDHDNKEIYIISGINASSREKKIDELIQYLGLTNEFEKYLLRQIGGDSRIRMADDEIKDEEFKRICSENPEKMIFWIDVIYDKNRLRFILQQLYNPEFYLKRKFKQVVIKNEIQYQLTEVRLRVKQQELLDSLEFANKYEKEFLQKNCEDGKIKIFIAGDDGNSTLQASCKKNQTVHFLRIEEGHFIWMKSCGLIDTLRYYIDHSKSEISLVEEDNLIEEIKNRKQVIIADDPGMGKSTTLIKLCNSLFETHWIIAINLRDHLEVIKDLKLVYGNTDVINFLSKVDIKLNNCLSKILLGMALDKKKSFSKTLLLALDGFDEVLDVEDRNKIISLLKFLKDETSAKLWITTRLHYKETLEAELTTIAIEFNPLDLEAKVAYIMKYLKDRLNLVFNEEKFSIFFAGTHEKLEKEFILSAMRINKESITDNQLGMLFFERCSVLGDNAEIPINRITQKFIQAFLNKMASVFKSNVIQFIGTPLQLYLMLEGSVKHYKYWIENGTDENPNFNYLGNDVREVYKGFINRKYNIYFEKKGIKEQLQRKQNKFFFNMCNTDFAEFLILKSKPKRTLEKFKAMVLSAGIIKSQGSHIEFIHTTFRDYFAAKLCIIWIRQASNKLLGINTHEYIMKDILKKPDYQLIRTFINLKLIVIAKTELFAEILTYNGMLFHRLIIEKESSFTDEKGTILHVAVEEGNIGIVQFVLNSLKKHPDSLRKFLFMSNTDKETALHLACEREECEIVRILLDIAAGISEDTLQEFFFVLDVRKRNALEVALKRRKNIKILKILLNIVKLDYFVNHGNKSFISRAISDYRKRHYLYPSLSSSFILACCNRNEECVQFLLQEFENDEKAIQLMLLHNCDKGNSLYVSVRSQYLNFIEILLSAAKSMKDNNDTLKKLLLPVDKYKQPFPLAIRQGHIDTVKILLDAAMGIDDHNYTLKQLLFNDRTQQSALWDKYCDALYNIDLLNKLLKERYDDKNLWSKFWNEECSESYNDKVDKYLEIIKLLLDTADGLGKGILEKLLFSFNKFDEDLIVDDNSFREKFLFGLFKIFKEDKYRDIEEKVIDMFFRIYLGYKFGESKKHLMSCVRDNNVDKVKYLLNTHKILTRNHPEKRRHLLLSVDSEKCRRNTLHIACEEKHTHLMEELLSQAIDINDEGETLKQLITSLDATNRTPFEIFRNVHGYKMNHLFHILETLILNAERKPNAHVVKILQEEMEKLDAEISSPSQESDLQNNSRRSLRSFRNFFKITKN